MNYQDTLNKIFSFLTFGREPSIKYMRELLDRIGSPDKQLKFVHIAGTNGKGSTCALIAAPLMEAGYKTALFVSPFIVEFCERFQINGQYMPKDTLPPLVEEILPVVQTMRDEGKIINEFELVTAIGMTWFAREKCDIVVLETGLGGRFDATNAIDCPLASVLTSISLDHTAILGNTVQEITQTKCGIIKKNGVTVAYADQPENTLELIRQSADEQNNRFYTASTEDLIVQSVSLDGTVFLYHDLPLKIHLLGEHQIKNASVALCVLERLKELGLDIPDHAIQVGFENAFMPCRLEVISQKPTIIIDGAHNEGGLGSLHHALNQYLPNTPKIAIIGVLADKTVSGALAEILPLFDEVITLTPDNPRALSADALAQKIQCFCKKVTAFENASMAWTYALTQAPTHAIIVFGSLFLASQLRHLALN